MASDTPVPDPFPNLLPNAMITPVPVSNERGTNLTNLTSLKVQNAKGGLGPSPFTRENKSQNELVYLHITNVLLNANNKNYNRCYNYVLVGKVLDMSWTCPWTTPLSSILLDIGIFEGQEDNFTDSVPRPASSLDFSH